MYEVNPTPDELLPLSVSVVTSGLGTCSVLHESLHRERVPGFDDPA